MNAKREIIAIVTALVDAGIPFSCELLRDGTWNIGLDNATDAAKMELLAAEIGMKHKHRAADVMQ